MTTTDAPAVPVDPAPFALEVDCVAKSYGGRHVLSSASLRASPRQVTALLGRNGIGKSTLLRIAAGVLAPETGIVRCDGVTVERISLARLAARGLFFLPDRDLLHSGLPLGAQLEAIAGLRGDVSALPAVVEMLRLQDRLAQSPRSLSGGERRRGEIAAALAATPRVLLADEPLRGIDPRDAETIMLALRTYARAGHAVVLTGHELPLLLPYADRIVWCHAGTTREYETADAAMANFDFRRDFLG